MHDTPLFQVRRAGSCPTCCQARITKASTFYPLKGKLLNVREANFKQVGENKINEIVKIIGLKYKKKYETDKDMRTLRYGKARSVATLVTN